jgi:predicted ABC-type transport system involved in lysophospholipase L1 biosynthesis ATPase subunit
VEGGANELEIIAVEQRVGHRVNDAAGGCHQRVAAMEEQIGRPPQIVDLIQTVHDHQDPLSGSTAQL